VVKYTTIQETKGKLGNGTVLITCAQTIDHIVREINFTKDSIGLIGLSDERLQCNFPEDSFRWIFRNYLCEKDNLEYLLTNLQEHKSNTYWFPLGYNKNFDPYKSIIPMRNRKYLWSWSVNYVNCMHYTLDLMNRTFKYKIFKISSFSLLKNMINPYVVSTIVNFIWYLYSIMHLDRANHLVISLH